MSDPVEAQRKPVDVLLDHASDLVNEMGELAQLVDSKIAAYIGAKPTDPTRGTEPVPACVGHFPQLGASLQVIEADIAWIRRSIDQL